MKQMTKDQLRLLRSELDAVLPEIAAKLGMSIKVGNGSYDATSGTLKVEAAMINDSGVVLTKEARHFKLYATSYGLEADDLNKTFITTHGAFQITGLSLRSSKFPVLVKEVSTGREYKYSADLVRAKLHPVVKAVMPTPKLIQTSAV